MTSPEFQDWAQPVGILDVASRVTAIGQTITPGGSIGPYNVNQQASLIIALRLAAGSGTDQLMLNLDWQESGSSANQDYLTYHDATAYAGAFGVLLWQVPIRGSSFYLRAYGTNANAQQVTITTSTRDVVGSTVRPIPTGTGSGVGQQTGRLLLDTGAIVVAAAGTSARFYIPPVARAIAVRMNQALTTTVLQLDSLYYLAGAMARDPFQYLGAAGSVPLAQVVQCPGMGLELTMFNGDAAAHSMHAYVWDVS